MKKRASTEIPDIKNHVFNISIDFVFTVCVCPAAINPSGVVSCRECCEALNALNGFFLSYSRLSKGIPLCTVFSLSRGLLKGPLLGVEFPASSRHAMFCGNGLFIDSGMRCACRNPLKFARNMV